MTYQTYTGEGDVGEAHQSLMRKESAEKERAGLGFHPEDLLLSEAVIRPIERKDAKPVIEQYEYLKCMPAISTHHFGIFFPTSEGERLGGVLVYGPDYAKNLGHWDKYGYTDNMLLLSRGVCLWWTPHNTASFFISRANRWLRENTDIRVITATVDAMAGEVGTIYQSLNWAYVGSMRRANPNIKAKTRSRFGVIIDGKLYGSRAIRSKIGSQRKAEILKRWPDAQFVKQREKERYFTFLGTKREKRDLRKSIEHLILPYPKRDIPSTHNEKED